MKRHFITIEDQSKDDLATIYELATAPINDELLRGQGVALVFERPSLRTRASSASAVAQLGGYATFFSDDEIGMDSRESAEDIARTLNEMYAIAAMRLKNHGAFARMQAATNSKMSLINLLSSEAHPTQAIADVLTIADEFAGGDVHGLKGLRVAYVGDATNVTRSLAVALLRLGVDVTVGAPDGYQLTPGGIENPFAIEGRKAGVLRLTSDAVEAVTGADVVYTDAWVSMGMEAETQKRRLDLADFKVTEELLAHANAKAILMHCLPAHRGDEITNEALDSEKSRVWQQVFHRRTAMLGVLRWLKGEK